MDNKKKKHTPGPWEVYHTKKYQDDGTEVLYYEVGQTLDVKNSTSVAYHFWPYSKKNEIEFRANAHLIAAAPDLLEALELAKRTIEAAHHGFSIAAQMVTIRAALAKARGE